MRLLGEEDRPGQRRPSRVDVLLDVRRLAAEVLLHVCGESCFKYTGAKCEHICRHGFYYIIALASDSTGYTFRRRRRGKTLRNALFVVKQSRVDV